MYCLIDNYDSFTYNLVHYLQELGAGVEVYRNDAITVAQVKDMNPRGIVLSPGPGRPDGAGICLDLIDRLGGTIPILGVCLGHQAIGQAFGGTVVQAPMVMHGKTSAVHHRQTDVFAGLANPFEATRYHSLILDRATFPDSLEITAETEDGLIMGLTHKSLPLYGVQFHPESIASAHGHDLLRNFIGLCEQPVAA